MEYRDFVIEVKDAQVKPDANRRWWRSMQVRVLESQASGKGPQKWIATGCDEDQFLDLLKKLEADKLELEAAAPGLGVQLRPVVMRAPDEIAPAARALLNERVDAVHFFAQPFFNAHRDRLAALTLEHRWPAVSGFEEDARAGILLFSGWRLEDAVRRVPYFLDRILTGTPPGELPVEQPSRFYLTVNLKTARALGLALPQPLLMQATEVIE